MPYFIPTDVIILGAIASRPAQSTKPDHGRPLTLANTELPTTSAHSFRFIDRPPNAWDNSRRWGVGQHLARTAYANSSPLEIALKLIAAVVMVATLLVACSSEPARPSGANVPAVDATGTPAPTESPAAEIGSAEVRAATTGSMLAPSSTAPPSATPITAATPPTPTAVHTSPPNILRVTVSEVPADLPQYERQNWKHWTDADGDCQVVRDEVLAAESRGPVSYRSDEGCRVAAGEWIAPYTGQVVTNPRELDIDHMVPFGNAHRSGAWTWSAERKEQYANYLGDPQHLIAVTASAKRSKGARGPEAWQPEDQRYWCQYAVDWITIKDAWGLTVTQAEHDALRQMLNTCSGDPQLVVERRDQVAPTPVPAGTPIPPTAAPPRPTRGASATGKESCATDRSRLVALYDATDGVYWRSKDNWLSENPIERWEGVGANADGCVTDLNLVRNNLYGRIPAELGGFEFLIHLDLTGNRLHGPIPPELAMLRNLTHLELGQNGLKGAIPVELGSLRNLNDLNLVANRLDGPIPPELAMLQNLNSLHLGLNELTGPIPPELGDLANLSILNLGVNELSGAIPAELGRLSGLQVLHLDFNQLSGPIPPELGRLVKLNHLTLGVNQLSGPIPPELGELVELRSLDLGPNSLTGRIPPELENLSNLIELSLGRNSLEGEIPGWIGSLSGLEDLYLYENRFVGTIPDALGDLSNLENVVLSDNRLSGAIPGSLGNLTQLKTLLLHGNRLSGAIPDELRNLTSLDSMFLSGNEFTGCLPPDLPSVTRGDLDSLDLPYCQ